MILYVILAALIVLNISAFLMYYDDKRRAICGDWRISEDALFVIAIIGGSVGAILGMLLLRHKTRHLKFRIGLPVILVLQIVLAIVLYKFFAAG